MDISTLSLGNRYNIQRLSDVSSSRRCILISLSRLVKRSRTASLTTCQAGNPNRGRGGPKGPRLRTQSDGVDHLGSAMGTPSAKKRQFPGPPPGQGPPLRILPIGGLGEIGMNCMLIGVYDRYILVDAGLMFPDFQDLGMQKILPDTSFLAEWRDRIEAVIITHGHEDHIGALPWVVPALDPGTPIYAGGFPMQLIKRRLLEYNLWDASRMHTINMREPFQAGPFQVEPFRVTHSIPDCCGLVLRSDQGTIVHTGDWKIDEDPVDGEVFDRPFFEQLGKEGVALFMSDSTNVLSPGRTTSEAVVRESLARRVLSHQGKGRIITTQFASNLHRLASVKKAADAAGRKIAFIGMSLTMYLEAAFREGRAPFNPKELVPQSEIDNMDPNELLIVTTGSQAEPRAALSLAAREASHMLKLQSSDLILYSAKVIPGNDTRVMQMMNSISELGPEIAMGRDENLHTSGHAYKGELEEVLQYIKPQHFLPVHGEYAFLCAHAQLAREVGVNYTSVIRNGQMLGVHERINANTVSTGSMAMLGDVALTNFYNDGNKGTGSAREMALEERQLLAVEGIVIAAIDVLRDSGGNNSAASRRRELETMMSDDGAAAVRRSLKARIRITTRAMWIDKGRLLESMHIAAEKAIAKLPGDASLAAVERVVTDALKRSAKAFNNRRPDVVVIAHEADPRAGAAMQASRRSGVGVGSNIASQGERGGGERGGGGGGGVVGGGVGYISEKEADVLLRERDSRRQAQREKDLLFAGKGGDIGELASPADSSVSEEEEYNSGSFSDEGRGMVSSKIAGGGGRSKLNPSLPSSSSPSSATAASYLDKAKQLAAKNKAVFGKGRAPPSYPLDPEVVERRKKANPRDTLPEGGNIEYP